MEGGRKEGRGGGAETGGTLPNSFSEASITLTPKKQIKLHRHKNKTTGQNPC